MEHLASAVLAPFRWSNNLATQLVAVAANTAWCLVVIYVGVRVVKAAL